MIQINVSEDIRQIMSQLSESRLCLFEKLKDKRLVGNNNENHFETFESIPLTGDQTRLWLVSQLNSDTHMLNLCSAYRFEGEIDTQRLQDAINRVANLQAMLRAYIDDSETPMLTFAKDVEIPLEFVTCTESEIEEQLTVASKGSFDLSRAPLCSCTLLHADNFSVLLVVMHHLIADGLSQDIFVDQVTDFYNDKNVQITSSFSAYQRWLAIEKSRSSFNDQRSFWKRTLKDVPAEIQLPTDMPRPEISKLQGATNSYTVSPETYRLLKQRLSESSRSEFSVLLAIYGHVLAQKSDQRDFVIGVPTASRLQPGAGNLIGFFANTSVVRFSVDTLASCSSLLDNIQSSVDDCFDHPLLGISDIIGIVNPERKGNYTPLIQVMFSFLPKTEAKHLGRIELQSLALKSDTAEFDVFWIARENTSGGLDVHVQFNSEIFVGSTIDNLFDDFIVNLEAVAHGAELKIPDKNVSQLEDFALLPIASNFTVDPLLPCLEYLFKESELNVSLFITEYDQVIQQLLNPSSSLHQSSLGGVLIISLEKWMTSDLQNHIGELTKGISVFYKSGGRLVSIVSTKPAPSMPSYQLDNIRQAENVIRSMATQYQFKFICYEDVDESHTLSNYYDDLSLELGDIPYTTAYYAAIAERIGSVCFHRLFNPFKVIVLDCDNTLWSGACGDLGANDIVIDEAHKEFQKKIVECHESGVLVCLASKNHEDSVDDVFKRNRYMVLKPNHVVASKVNWEPKSSNLIELSKELNLGLDSFLFIDDNPVEIADISRNCPEVTCLRYPESLEHRKQFALHNWLFNFPRSSDIDSSRTQLYRDNFRRSEIADECKNLEEFIARLGVEFSIEPIASAQIDRASQMTYRTNQFNSTTIRRDEHDFREILSDHGLPCFIVSVNDKYGDYGTVGLIILKYSENVVEVETFLMSCRVLGRSIESRMVQFIGSHAIEKGYCDVQFNVFATSKNEPLRRFYDAAFGSGNDFIFDGKREYRIDAYEAASIALVFEQPVHEKRQAQLVPKRVNQERFQKLLAVLGQPDRLAQLAKENVSPTLDIKQKAESEQFIDSLQQHKASPHQAANICINGTDKPQLLDISEPALSRHSQSETEESIESVWCEILALDSIDRNSNFFDIGGTSVLMVRINAELRRRFDLNLSMVDLFKYPTISGLVGFTCGSNTKVITKDFSASRGSKQRQLLQRTLQRKVR